MKKSILLVVLLMVMVALAPAAQAGLSIWRWDDPASGTDGWSCFEAMWVDDGYEGGGLSCKRTEAHDGWRIEVYYADDEREIELAGDMISFDIWTENGVLPAVCNSRALLEFAGVSRCAGARLPIEVLENGWARMYMHHTADMNSLDFNLFWRPAGNDPGLVKFDNIAAR